MSGAGLTRAERRLLKKQMPGIERVANEDRLFFERNPDRRFRMRAAVYAEIRQIAALNVSPPKPGYIHAVVVENIAPGWRVRNFCRVPNFTNFARISDSECATGIINISSAIIERK